MGLKKALTDSNTDAKKRRRVVSSSIDVGVEANDCIKIYLVGKEEEVGGEDGCLIVPIDLNRFFDEDGKIYGYKGLKINIFFSTISFCAYADITFQSTSDGGKGITDLKPALQKIFGESLVDKKEDFLQSFSADTDYVRNILSNGEVVHRKATKGDKISSNRLNADNFTMEYQIIRMAVNNMAVGELYCQLVPLVLLLVDGSSPIDITDHRWEIYLVVESITDDLGDVHIKLLGFAALYRFYYYPESSRMRISQILVLSPYQGQGHGRFLLEFLNSVALSENVYDLTFEEPSEYLQYVRTCIDTLRLLTFEPIKDAIRSVASHLKKANPSKKTCKLQSDPPTAAVEDVRRNMKITKKQFLQCWEILIYLELDQNDSRPLKNFKTLIRDRTRDSLLAKDTGDAQKQILKIPDDDDHEMAFVMFSPSDNVKVENMNAEIDVNQNNLEQQLEEVVEERMQEIMAIAEKVALHRQ